MCKLMDTIEIPITKLYLKYLKRRRWFTQFQDAWQDV